MLYLIIASVILFLWLKKALQKNICRAQDDYLLVKKDLESLSQENISIKQSNRTLEKNAEDIIGLYDITKDICKTMDTDKVFDFFKEEAGRYVRLKDCRLLKADADLTPYQGHAIFPLRVDSLSAGYLVTEGIEEEDKDKFHILQQQLLLGMKRALLYQQVQELAITDTLTHTYSRRYCLDKFMEEIERSKRYNYSFSCLMVDIDHFKDCNDQYGHLVGDIVLAEVSRAIKDNIRQVDLISRYGGEEFLILLAETDKEDALFVAERIRRDIAQKEVKAYDEVLRVTISIGISVFPLHAQDMQRLIKDADDSLYLAKQAGRNRVCVYSPT